MLNLNEYQRKKPQVGTDCFSKLLVLIKSAISAKLNNASCIPQSNARYCQPVEHSENKIIQSGLLGKEVGPGVLQTSVKTNMSSVRMPKVSSLSYWGCFDSVLVVRHSCRRHVCWTLDWSTAGPASFSIPNVLFSECSILTK